MMEMCKLYLSLFFYERCGSTDDSADDAAVELVEEADAE